MALFNADGQINLTTTPGSTYTGAQAADGSYYIVINDGSTYTGVRHRCGALNAVLDETTNAAQHRNGSVYVKTQSDGSGYTFSTSLGGASSLLTAPTLTWTSGTTDNTPDLSVTFPDILVTGADVTFEYGTSPTFVGATSVIHDLTTPEAVAQAMTLALSVLADDTWYIRVKYEGSAWSNTVTKTIDAAPALTSPVGTKTGVTTADLSVITSQSGGTLHWVLTTSATPPSAAQVKAGQNDGGSAAAASGNQAVSATGSQTHSVTGLTSATTYYAYFMHEDAGTNQSNVAAASSFVTDTGNPAFTLASTATSPTGSGTVTRTWTGVDIGNPAYIATRRVVAIALGVSSSRTLSSALINGVAATTLTTVNDSSGNGLGCCIASAVVSSGTTGVSVSFTFSSGEFAANRLLVYIVDDSLLTSPTPTTIFDNEASASVTSNGNALAVSAGGTLIAVNIRGGGSAASLTTNDAALSVDLNSSTRFAASKSNLAAATYNETISWTTAALTGLTLITFR